MTFSPRLGNSSSVFVRFMQICQSLGACAALIWLALGCCTSSFSLMFFLYTSFCQEVNLRTKFRQIESQVCSHAQSKIKQNSLPAPSLARLQKSLNQVLKLKLNRAQILIIPLCTFLCTLQLVQQVKTEKQIGLYPVIDVYNEHSSMNHFLLGFSKLLCLLVT